MHATVAQSVERRLGKAEVGGSIPLGSFHESTETCKKEKELHIHACMKYYDFKTRKNMRK